MQRPLYALAPTCKVSLTQSRAARVSSKTGFDSSGGTQGDSDTPTRTEQNPFQHGTNAPLSNLRQSDRIETCTATCRLTRIPAMCRAACLTTLLVSLLAA